MTDRARRVPTLSNASTARARRRPHAALGARWMTFGLAVSTTVGMSAYLEIDAFLHDQAAAGTASAMDPQAPATQAPVTQAPATQPPIVPPTVVTSPPPTVPATVAPRVPATVPAPPSIVVRPRPAPLPSTHARTRGSNP